VREAFDHVNLKLARSVLEDAFVASAVIRNSLFASGVTIVLPCNYGKKPAGLIKMTVRDDTVADRKEGHASPRFPGIKPLPRDWFRTSAINPVSFFD
jgi:hypothetical protein